MTDLDAIIATMSQWSVERPPVQDDTTSCYRCCDQFGDTVVSIWFEPDGIDIHPMCGHIWTIYREHFPETPRHMVPWHQWTDIERVLAFMKDVHPIALGIHVPYPHNTPMDHASDPAAAFYGRCPLIRDKHGNQAWLVSREWLCPKRRKEWDPSARYVKYVNVGGSGFTNLVVMSEAEFVVRFPHEGA